MKTNYLFTDSPSYPDIKNKNLSFSGKSFDKAGWIYFINGDEGGLLSRIRDDKQGQQIISSHSVQEFKLYKDWIYYTGFHKKFCMFKMLLDGSESRKLNDISCRYLNVSAKGIFFSNLQDNGKLYFIDFARNQPQRLNNEESWMVTYYEGWIYYISKTDSLHLKRISEDGSKIELLISDDCISFRIHDGILYYSNHNHNNSLFSYVIKTHETNWIHSDSCWNYLIHQNHIFYMNATDNCKLYSMKTDGTDHKLLDNSVVWYPLQMNQWLYFSNWSEGKRLYRITFDGKTKEAMNQQASLRLASISSE
ncbi:DUF5050 domain-containing protein [bacterium]|nr:DUF5050 domain-containing protein [bacterium]